MCGVALLLRAATALSSAEGADEPAEIGVDESAADDAGESTT